VVAGFDSVAGLAAGIGAMSTGEVVGEAGAGGGAVCALDESGMAMPKAAITASIFEEPNLALRRGLIWCDSVIFGFPTLSFPCALLRLRGWMGCQNRPGCRLQASPTRKRCVCPMTGQGSGQFHQLIGRLYLAKGSNGAKGCVLLALEQFCDSPKWAINACPVGGEDSEPGLSPASSAESRWSLWRGYFSGGNGGFR